MFPAPVAAITPSKLIPTDVNTVAHVWWNGAKLVDKKGNAWAMNGTVPQVPRNGAVPPGAGPFSDANYYTLGTGNDVLDFPVDFSAHAIVIPQPSAPGHTETIFDDSVNTATGLNARLSGAGPFGSLTNRSGGVNESAQTANAAIANVPNVLSFGRVGLTHFVKLNLGATASVAIAAWIPATTSPAAIGRFLTVAGESAGQLSIVEMMLTSTPFVEATVVAIQQRIKARLGITAW